MKTGRHPFKCPSLGKELILQVIGVEFARSGVACQGHPNSNLWGAFGEESSAGEHTAVKPLLCPFLFQTGTTSHILQGHSFHTPSDNQYHSNGRAT